MGNKTSRAVRRHHRFRLIRRTLQRLKNQNYRYSDPITDRRRAVRMWDNMTVCSCSMCCNSRHNKFLNKEEQVTMQERRHLSRIKYEMIETITTSNP